MSQQNDANEPLYKQLEETLRQDIENGVYRKGERFPTELELSERYNVSRITVRNALKELTKENLLVRYRRRGTFVMGDKMQRTITRFSSFSDVCREQGIQPGAKVIKSLIEHATAADIDELGLPEDAHIIVIERIRYADGVPVSLEIDRFPLEYSFLLDLDLNNCSLYDLLKERGITMANSTKIIELTFASYEMAHYLGVKDGYPLISIKGVVSDSEGNKVHRGLQFIVGDKFKLIV